MKIDPSAVDPEDVEILADMVLAAVNEALRMAQELVGPQDGRRHRRHGPGRPRRAGPAGPVSTSYSPPVQTLVTELSRLPGVGNRTAQRLAFHILRASAEDAAALAEAIREVKEKIGLCEVCFNLTDETRCRICQDPRRDHGLICVVEEPSDVIPMERTHEYHGVYHVLGGALSPIDGIDPEDLKIAELFARVGASGGELAGAARSCWPRTPRPPARPPRCTSPRSCAPARPGSRSRAWPAACRWARIWSTPTR